MDPGRDRQDRQETGGQRERNQKGAAEERQLGEAAVAFQSEGEIADGVFAVVLTHAVQNVELPPYSPIDPSPSAKRRGGAFILKKSILGRRRFTAASG